eukprot:744474-Prymnesium_polylepis.1
MGTGLKSRPLTRAKRSQPPSLYRNEVARGSVVTMPSARPAMTSALHHASAVCAILLLSIPCQLMDGPYDAMPSHAAKRLK